jgi:hypothetical protein
MMLLSMSVMLSQVMSYVLFIAISWKAAIVYVRAQRPVSRGGGCRALLRK